MWNMWKNHKEAAIKLHKARHNPESDFILVEVSYKGRLLTYQHNNKEENLDIENYMESIQEKAVNIIRNGLRFH